MGWGTFVLIGESLLLMGQSERGQGKHAVWGSYVEQLEAADLTVPVEHIVRGRVRRDGRIERAHSAQVLPWLLGILRDGVPSKGVGPEDVDLGPRGKNLFPSLIGGDEALRRALSGESGVVRQVLEDPKRIIFVSDGIWRSAREVVIVDDELRYSVVVEVATRPTRRQDPRSFVVATAYPVGGDGVINVDHRGRVKNVHRKWGEDR